LTLSQVHGLSELAGVCLLTIRTYCLAWRSTINTHSYDVGRW